MYQFIFWFVSLAAIREQFDLNLYAEAADFVLILVTTQFCISNLNTHSEPLACHNHCVSCIVFMIITPRYPGGYLLKQNIQKRGSGVEVK